MTAPGVPIVLTADRTLTGAYHLLFDGMLAASQSTLTPAPILHGLLSPRARRRRLAPLGLRRLEAALLRGGFSADELAVVDEAEMEAIVGARTRVVGISSGEPCGKGMSSTTITSVVGGRIYPQVMFERLLRRVRVLLAARAPDAKVVLGGPGAWQLAADERAATRLGIDHIVTGYAEANAAALFRSLQSGEDLPRVIEGQAPRAEEIPPVVGPVTMGMLEISRGCGWGCGFCSLGQVPMQHLPAATILADARTNLTGGARALALLSEDFFRYGGAARHVVPEAVLGLLERLRALPGVGLLQADHANITSVAAFSDAQLRRARELLVGDTGCRLPWVNLGVETASGELLMRVAAGKMAGTPPDDWANLCARQVCRLNAAGLLPMVSLMLGLPGETASDVRLTLEWVRSLRSERVAVFPVLYAPLDGSPPMAPADLSHLHWQLIRECYELNFRWIPRMYWDNQRAVDVSWVRRMVLQALGRGQVLLWKTILRCRQEVARA